MPFFGEIRCFSHLVMVNFPDGDLAMKNLIAPHMEIQTGKHRTLLGDLATVVMGVCRISWPRYRHDEVVEAHTN